MREKGGALHFLSGLFQLLTQSAILFHKFCLVFSFWVCDGFSLAFFAEFTAPCRNTGFGYAVFRSNAFVGASFIQMETDNFLFEFGCVTSWHDDSLFPVF